MLKKIISHVPSPPWTANKGGNRAVGIGLISGQMWSTLGHSTLDHSVF